MSERNGHTAGRAEQLGLPSVPGYRITGLIGHGGQATVYVGEQLDETRRRLALKVFQGHVSHPSTLKRFEREAGILGRLDRHPNIVSVYAAGKSHGHQPYIAIELMEGGSLASIIRKRGPLPADIAARVTQQVASALQFAHDEGVIHQDVKPANVLLTSKGDAKLADFGTAWILDSTNATQDAGRTPEYCDPGRLLNGRTTAQSDVYSLGVTLHEMVSGVSPFNPTGRADGATVHRAVLQGDAAPLPVGLPSELAAVIRRAMALDPADRFESAGALSDSLQGVLGAAGYPPDGPTQLDPVGLATTMFLTDPPTEPRDVSLDDNRRRPRRSGRVAFSIGVSALAVVLAGGFLWGRAGRSSEREGSTPTILPSGSTTLLPAAGLAPTSLATSTTMSTTTTTSSSTTTTAPTTTAAPPPVTVPVQPTPMEKLAVVDKNCVREVTGRGEAAERPYEMIAGYGLSFAIDLGRTDMELGICVDEQSHMVFALRGEYSKVSGVMGFRDSWVTEAQATVAARCDGRELFSRRFGKGERIPIEFDVGSCQQLRFETTIPTRYAVAVADLVATP